MERSTDAAVAGTTASDQISREELQLATRNHGMPLEALRYPVTPLVEVSDDGGRTWLSDSSRRP